VQPQARHFLVCPFCVCVGFFSGLCVVFCCVCVFVAAHKTKSEEAVKMLKSVLVVLLSAFLAVVSASNSTCVCTTVTCPTDGTNSLTPNGGGSGLYTYSTHNGYAVVTSVKATITKSNLDMGTDTTSCTQDYSRMLDDVSVASLGVFLILEMNYFQILIDCCDYRMA
jgi:hypothetical protein